jgi:DedD protein
MTVEQDEILLRKKARRRLVGAILLSLIVILSLPLVLEDPSQPLGDGPEIVIPEPARLEPPQAAKVPDSMPEGQVGEEALPVEAGGVPGQGPASAPAPASAVAKPAAPSPAPSATPALAPAPSPPAADKSIRPDKAEQTERPAVPEQAGAAPPAAAGYVLQLGLFKARANADKVAAQASSLGLKPVVAQTSAGSWRVGLGPYTDKAEALAARDKVRDAGMAVVLKAP